MGLCFCGDGVQKNFLDLPKDAVDRLQERLRGKLQELNQSQVLGSRLGPMINESLDQGATYRDFFPPGTNPKLKAFVEHALIGLVVPTALKQGVDLIYEVKDPIPSVQSINNGALWKSCRAAGIPSDAQKTVRLVRLRALGCSRRIAEISSIASRSHRPSTLELCAPKIAMSDECSRRHRT